MSGRVITGQAGRDGYKARDDWMKGFLAVAVPAKFKPRAIALVARLFLHFNCKTGQCNPLYETLAKELGVSEKTVQRAVSELEGAGWLKRNHKTKDFTLMIPPTGWTTCCPPRDSSRDASRNAHRVDTNEGQGGHERGGSVDTQGVRTEHLNTENTEGARPKRAPPERVLSVDRVVFKNRKETRASSAVPSPEETELRQKGREVLGYNADSLVTRLLKSYGGAIDDAIDTINEASEELQPARFIEEILESRKP